MTCKMHLKEGSVRIGVPQHIYIFGLNLRSEDGGSIHFWKGLFTWSWGGGRKAKVYIFGKVSLPGVQKFQNQSHMSYKLKRKAFMAEA